VLLAAAPRQDAVPRELLTDAGTLLPKLALARDYLDRVLGTTVALPHCFEHPAPPSRAFLRWLIENPDKLRWPERPRGTRVRYGRRTQEFREALVDGPDDARSRAQAEGLAALEARGPAASKRQWWAFEGHTEVDCWLETERLLLFIEGKRTDTLSSSTDWFPLREQLVRNLEVVGEQARGRWAAVLLVTEEPGPELTPAGVAASAPHLDKPELGPLFDRYLGQTTWRALCERLGVDFAGLPETIDDC
jgi:hypothetical protein